MNFVGNELNLRGFELQLFTYAFWFYGMKFIPSLINVASMAVFNLRWTCKNMENATCSWVYPVPEAVESSGGKLYKSGT